jgi:GRAS domain family
MDGSPSITPCMPGKDASNLSVLKSSEHSDITSDPTLEFISRILLEEEIDELNITGFKEAPALHDMEKTFYDIIGHKHPPSPIKSLDVSQLQSDPEPTTEVQGSLSSTSEGSVQDSRIENIMVTEFERGIAEGKKFLPTINKQVMDLQQSTHSIGLVKHKDDYSVGLCEEVKSVGSKSKKSIIDPDLGHSEGRQNKISMVYPEEPVRDDTYDKVLLDHEGDYAKEQILNLQESIQHEANSGIYTQTKEGHTELQLLLHQCSEAVAIDDRLRAKKLVEQIRKQSSRNGNGIQRLACILADALEARLAGIGREYYQGIMTKRVIAPDSYFLKAYHLYLTAAPFVRVYFSFANNNIIREAENASKLHIVDLGINHGFQWPPLIQALAKRKGGPPNLRITGIDFPQPGFRPAKKVEEIGKRLENYARSFMFLLSIKLLYQNGSRSALMI